MLFLSWCYLIHVCWASFGPTTCSFLNDSVWSLDLYLCYFELSWPITLFMGSFVQFLSSWASLTHLFSLTHLLSLAHFLILHSHGLLLTLLGFFGPITLSLILGAHGLSINPLLSYFITSGLLWPILTFSTSHCPWVTFSLRAILSQFAFLKAHLFTLWAYDPLFLPLRLNVFFFTSTH